jgi:hypothetical protein
VEAVVDVQEALQVVRFVVAMQVYQFFKRNASPHFASLRRWVGSRRSS